MSRSALVRKYNSASGTLGLDLGSILDTVTKVSDTAGSVINTAGSAINTFSNTGGSSGNSYLDLLSRMGVKVPTNSGSSGSTPAPTPDYTPWYILGGLGLMGTMAYVIVSNRKK